MVRANSSTSHLHQSIFQAPDTAMRTKLHPAAVWAAVLIAGLRSTSGQGTFVYDQQSANEGTGGGGNYNITERQPIGQSFTPSLSSIGFVRLRVVGSLGASIQVILRSTSITGPVLGTSETISFAALATGYSNFVFSVPVALTPGVTYYFQPVVLSGNGLVTAYNYDYPGGTAYFYGAPDSFLTDLWFREGIIVPEPSLGSLWATGAGILLWRSMRGSRPTTCRRG